MDDGLLNQPQNDNQDSSVTPITSPTNPVNKPTPISTPPINNDPVAPVTPAKPVDDETQKKIDEALSVLPDNLEKPVTESLEEEKPEETSSLPSTPSASLSSNPLPPLPEEPKLETEEVKPEKPEIIKPPNRIVQEIKKNGKKIAGGMVVVALLLGGTLVGRNIIQQRQVVESEAVKGGRKGLTGDDVFIRNGKYYVTSKDGESVSLLKDDDPLVVDKQKKDGTYVAPQANVTEGDTIADIQGRTIYVLPKDGGKKKVISIKNDATFDALKGAANRDNLTVTEFLNNKGISSIPEFNKIVSEEITRQNIYKLYSNGQTLTYQVCVEGTSEGSECNGGYWETRVFENADQAWAYVSKAFTATAMDADAVNIFYCPGGLEKNVCNDKELLTMDQNLLFYTLTGSGELGESLAGLCGGFQVDVGMATWASASVGDSSLSFTTSCGTRSEGNGGGDSYACASLDSSPSAEINLGDSLEVTCEANFSGYSPVAYFRYSKDGEVNWIEEVTGHDLTVTNPAKYDLTVDDYGDWIIQCQVCTDNTKSSCTTWGQAN